MPVSPVSQNEHRTWEQLKEHYEVEKELAARLRASSREERRELYTTVYNELFQRIPHHLQLTRKASIRDTVRTTTRQFRILHRYLGRGIVFMEVGPGDCTLSILVARSVRTVYALDVSEEITRHSSYPPNLNLIHFDGSVIPLPPNSVHVAYSNQLMEHLHPDDAVEQLRSIQRVLTPHGVYVCLTPNRLTGPHDISKYFEDEVASGFHLKEYTNTEVEHLFKLVGFSRVKAFGLARGFSVRFPVWTVRLIEHCVQLLPGKVGKMLARSKGMKIFVNRFYLVAEK